MGAPPACGWNVWALRARGVSRSCTRCWRPRRCVRPTLLLSTDDVGHSRLGWFGGGGGGMLVRLRPTRRTPSQAPVHRMRSQRADSQTRGVSRAPRAAHGQRGAFERLSIHRGVAVTLRATSPARGGRVVVTPGATRAVFTPCRASPRVARETSAVKPCCATLCWCEVRVARGVAPFVARRPSAAHRGGAACARLARWHAPSRRCSCRAGLYRSRLRRLRARWSVRGRGARGRVGARPMGGSDRICSFIGASAPQATQG